MKPKLVAFIGGAGTGKTTLACALKEYFMMNKISTDVCTEYAREFVFEYGFPESAFAQYKITLNQKHREDILCQGKNEYIFSDCPVWLSYIYTLPLIKADSSKQVKAVAADIYKEFVIDQMDRYHKVFYIQNDNPFDDGCKHDIEIQKLINNNLESFVQLHENLLPIIRMDIPIEKTEERKKFVLDNLKGVEGE